MIHNKLCDRFRVRRPPANGPDIIKGSELVGSITAYVWHDTPEALRSPEVEYYCENVRCPVREVTIHLKFHNGRRPAKLDFFCPKCGHALKFHRWLKSVTLIPDEPTHEEGNA